MGFTKNYSIQKYQIINFIINYYLMIFFMFKVHQKNQFIQED
jgi:hypothetical protein